MKHPPSHRVACLTPTLNSGGAERVLVNLLKMLPECERHLVLFENRVFYEFDAELHVLAGQFGFSGPLLPRLRGLAENLARLVLLKRRLPATWISFTTWANLLNVLARGPGRVVLTSHSHESTAIGGRSAPLVRKLVRLTYPRADAIVAVSSAVKRDLIENLGVAEDRVITIHNTVDTEEAERLAKEPVDADVDRFLAGSCILAAGTLRPEKGHWHLLRAFAALKREGASARLALLGDGPLRGYLTNLSRELGLATHVRGEPGTVPLEEAAVAFLGFHTNPFAMIARATVFAFSSISEGFGNVVIEALALGVPVISTDCHSGPREILAPEQPEVANLTEPEYATAGILMPRFDGVRRPASEPLDAVERLWADTLRELLASEFLRERYAGAGPPRARAFSLSAIAPAWRAVLASGR